MIIAILYNICSMVFRLHSINLTLTYIVSTLPYIDYILICTPYHPSTTFDIALPLLLNSTYGFPFVYLAGIDTFPVQMRGFQESIIIINDELLCLLCTKVSMLLRNC